MSRTNICFVTYDNSTFFVIKTNDSTKYDVVLIYRH